MTREEAINIYQGLINPRIKEAFEFFAPELAESEDERIREELLDCLRNLIIKPHEKKLRFMAWLERLNLADLNLLKEFNKGMREALMCGREGYEVSPDGKVKSLTQDEIDSTLEKQKEQKPDTRTADDLQLLGFIYDLLASLDWREDYAMSRDECLRKLNDYRPQKPTEWSEEDELNCNRIIRFLEPHKTFFPMKETKEEMQNWLKNRLTSLRPQPHWKPSEEQLEALRIAVKKLAKTDVDHSVRLCIMYDNLKKLM